jgi:hypothetical protein
MRIPRLVLGLALLAASPVLPADAGFDARFTGRTLRCDYFHGGIAKEEHVSLDKLRLEGDWPGSRVHLRDDTNLGKYFFEVIDPATNQAIWSRGFSSIYGEWETTGEAAAGTWRTFHESMRFPEPRGKVQLVIKKRALDGGFRDIFSTVVDPAARFVDRSPVSAAGKVWTVFENGPPAVKVDLLLLGDGYAAGESAKFHADVHRLTDALFATEPYKTHRSDFNVRAIDLPSSASGVTDPRTATWHKTPLGLAYNAFGPRGGDGGALPGGPREDDPDAPERKILRHGGSLPGLLLPGERALPAGGGLHHVQPQPEIVLRRLRPRHRADDPDVRRITFQEKGANPRRPDGRRPAG